MRAVWSVAVVAFVALAGCSGDDVSQDEADQLVGEGGPSQPQAQGGPNRAPVVTMTLSNESGEAPLDVTFTIQPQDTNRDELTLALDVDGDGAAEVSGRLQHRNGTYEPYEYRHTYTRAGSYNVTAGLSDGEATAQAKAVVDVFAEGGGPDADMEFEDRGWYEYEIATGQCHVKSFQELVPGVLYNSPLSGGDWFIVEANGVAGLQIENNHPEQATGLFSLDIPDCVDGDQVAA